MGRPTKLTAAVQAEIVAHLEAGGYAVRAAEAAGISEQTFYEWLRRGERPGSADRPYRAFKAAVESARAEGEQHLVRRVAQAGRDDWRAAAWLLERQYPERWAKPSDRRTLADSDTAKAEAGQADPLAFDELEPRRRAARAGNAQSLR